MDQPSATSAVTVETRRDGDFASRLLVAAAAALVVLAKLPARVDLGEIAYEYRHGLAALAGLIWWALLQPSILGLVLLAASAAGRLNSWLRQPKEASR